MKYPHVAYRFKKILNDNGINAQELSNITGVGKSSISHYVNGTHCPSDESAEKIASHFNLNPAWLMGYDVVQKRPKEPFDYDSPKYIINSSRILQKLYKNNSTIEMMSSETNIPLEKLKNILDNAEIPVSEKELRDISAYLEVSSMWLLRSSLDPTVIELSQLVKELGSIKETLNNKSDNPIASYTDEEIKILDAYRNSDDLTRAMVRRTLGID